MAKAWNNGKYSATGAGYGIKLTEEERDALISVDWPVVDLSLPDGSMVRSVVTGKASMWTGNCRELIHRDIGLYMINAKLAPWPKGEPPSFAVSRTADRTLSISLVSKR